MAQASLLDGFTLDLFPLVQNFLCPAMIGVVAEALMVAAVVVMLEEGGHLALEISGQVMVFEQHAVFQRLVPALDLALSLWMTWYAADVFDISPSQSFGQIARDVTRPVIGQQARLVRDFS